MTVKQPLNPLSPQTAVLAAAGVVRAQKPQPGQRVAPLEDDSDKHNGRVREGHDKAYEDTFGAGSFDANVGDGRSYNGDGLTITSGTYDGPSTSYYEDKEKDLRIFEAAYKAAGESNPLTLSKATYDDFYYDSFYHHSDYQSAPMYNTYTQTFDTSDPATNTYLESARFSFNEEGKLTTIDDGMSCLNASKKGGRAEAILNAYADGGPQNLTNKVDEVKAAVPDPDGYLMFDGKRMHVNSPNGKQIIVAQQQLAAGVEPTALGIKNILNLPPEELAAGKRMKLNLDTVPGQSPDDIFIASGGPKAGPEQDTKFQSVMAKTTAPVVVNNFGQGNDLFMVTKSLQDNKFAPLTKPTELSASTTAPAIADPVAPAPTSPLLKPTAPAPAPAFAV